MYADERMMMRRGVSVMLAALAVLTLGVDPGFADIFGGGHRYGYYADQTGRIAMARFAMMAIPTGIGFALGWVMSPAGAPVRMALLSLSAVVAVIVALFNVSPLGWSAAVILAWVGFLFGLGYWLGRGVQALMRMPTTFGSSRWATADDLAEAQVLGQNGVILGSVGVSDTISPLCYPGDRHLLTVAPTRSGKGVSHIVPNLLTYGGSTLVIDPKGENAMITAKARAAMGQEVLAVDPWGITAGTEGLTQARFNPLDWLQPGDVDITENAMLLTDAIVQPVSGKADPFWREESKGLIQGLLMFVAVDAQFEGKRHLGTVRDLLLLSGPEMKQLFQDMARSPHQVVASTGARSLQKEDKLMANVLAAAQAETHMLDSMRLRESLSASDFKFDDMKTKPMTIYLILPADRLETFSRFLRLLVQQAITVNARAIETKPEKPILFILDEMAALGRLAMVEQAYGLVEQAYGLMAGFGIQIWGVVQDLCQLHRVYGEDYESFIANAGAVAYFGSPDKRSAEYFSTLCGQTTVRNISTAIATAVSRGFGGGGANGSSTETDTQTTAAAQRKLAFPDELMRLHRDRQLVLIENTHPILARKARWFEDPMLKAKGVSLHG